MGLVTFSINVTLDGCVDHKEAIADDLGAGVQKLKDATPDGYSSVAAATPRVGLGEAAS